MPSNETPGDTGKVSLRRWRVSEIQTPDGKSSRHVWGHDVTNNLGRASSAIKEFDFENMVAITRSGKHYVLIGVPASSRIGLSAWKKWCKDNCIVSERDVTDDYLNTDDMSTVGFNKVVKSVTS